MFAVDEAAAEAIRRAYKESGELAAVVEFRKHFPLVQDHDLARACVRVIVKRRGIRTPIGAINR